MSKWIEFRGPFPSVSGTTNIWHVMPLAGGNRIGQVRWYGPWRKYTFWPEPNCVFEEQCLRDIAAFCETQTKDHRLGKKTPA